jgi:hypothetical protein
MKKAFLLLLATLPFAGMAQDSTSAGKRFTQELGVNSVLLVKQLISNDPDAALEQLPYQVIYTLQSNRTKMGFRAGLGLTVSRSETEIQGLNKPRVINSSSFAMRAGINKNFLDHKKIVANSFIDVITSRTATRTETQTSLGPGIDVITILENENSAFGLDLGFGVKYKFNQHISLYTEVPLQIAATTSSNYDSQIVQGSGNTTTISKGSGIDSRIFLPTTLFLVISF